MNLLATVANFILPGIFKEVDKVIPDQDLGAKLKASIQTAVLSADAEALQSQAGIVTAEAKGESWLQRNWRPVTMMVFVFIVANNYIIAPYAQAISGASVSLPTPPDLWALIKIGLGGYVVGRSAEKCVAAWKG
ncbi:MAG TPA: 3TM-type holin [Gammaproteobacteria bacterium]